MSGEQRAFWVGFEVGCTQEEAAQCKQEGSCFWDVDTDCRKCCQTGSDKETRPKGEFMVCCAPDTSSGRESTNEQ